MSTITFNGGKVNTSGKLPEAGSKAPDFLLRNADLEEVSLKKYEGKKVVLNIFPSLDTPTCAISVRTFNKRAGEYENTVVLCISKDLPFAQSRFCTNEGLKNVVTLSEYGNNDFSTAYGVLMTDGPLKGLMARAVVVLNEKGKVTYTELVSEIAEEPDYAKAEEALK